jgi:hypothetical protein
MVNTGDVNIKVKVDTTELQKLSKDIKKQMPEFAGYAMSVMFFGMAMQRVFTNIARTSTKAFQDVMHSVEGTITQFDMLEGSMQYLGFSIGAALEPVIAYLIPIIDAVAEWVNENPKLTAGIISIGIALGAILMTAGMLKLAFDGFAGTLVALKAASVAWGVSLGAVVGWAAVAIAAIVLLVAAWKTNFLGFRDFMKGFFGGMWTFIKGFFSGDLGMMWEGLKQSMVSLLKFIGNIAAGLAALIYNAFAFIFNSINGLMIGLVRKALELTKSLIQGVNSMLPSKFQIGTGGLDRALSSLNSFQNALNIGYISPDDVKQTAQNVTDMRVFNINIDRNTDQGVVDSIVSAVKRY